MYEEYFGLERSPFKITPDTSLFYEGGKRGDILAALVYAIHRGEGIIKVVGEVGSGKTMLCRMLQLQVPDTVEIVYIANPSVSAEDILFVIAHELSLPVNKGASKHEVMHMLQDYLLQRHMENKQIVLFVEEAQGMPLETLEEIRLLSNLETDEHKLLQIILFGQPELDDNLALKSIRQLRERITHNFNLEPLTQQEIHSYLNFRMREVGYTGPELISNAVARKVEAHSAGLLRRINIIADKILLSAFAEGTHNLSAKHVTAAVNDSTFGHKASRRVNWLWWLLPLVLAAMAATMYQTRSHWLPWAAATFDSVANAFQSEAEPESRDELSSSPEATVAMAADTVEITPVEEIEPSAPQPEAVTEPVVIEAETTATVQQAVEPAPEEVEPAAEGAAAVEEAPEAAAKDVQTEQETADIESLSAEVDVLLSQVEVAVQEANSAPEPTEKGAETDTAGAQTTRDAAHSDAGNSLTGDYRQWLNAKLEQSKQWLSAAAGRGMSIQVMMRSKNAAPELVYYLRNEWPLDITSTYVYEYTVDDRSIYRVFYGEYGSLAQARTEIERLPESVKINSPYVHSLHRMQKTLL